MNDTVIENEYPFIVFRIRQDLFTINSFDVLMIMRMPICEQVPNSPIYLLGLAPYQNHMIPVYDLRVLLGKESLKEEYDAFVQMLEDRKQDHIEWAKELERSLTAKEPFSLTTDPHACKFGKWYDTYTSDSNSVNFYLKKIDEPHRNLHEAAEQAAACASGQDDDKRAECLAKVLHKVKNQYVPKILQLLDGAKDVMRDSYHQMLLVLSVHGRTYALAVDEVLAVEELEPVGDNESIRKAQTTILSVQKSPKYQQKILEIDYQTLIESTEASRINQCDDSE